MTEHGAIGQPRADRASAAANEEGLRLTTYFGERDRSGGHLLGDRLLEVYGAERLRASVLLRGIEGFGTGHHLHTERLLSLSEDLPLVASAVDRAERIEAALGRVLELAPRGPVTLERVLIAGAELGQVCLPERMSEETKLTVHLGRHERVGRMPAFVAVTDLLHRRGLAGATVMLGVDGTSGGRRERARFFARNAAVPMLVVAIGDGAGVAGVLGELAALLRDPVITLERVQVCKRDGELLAPPRDLPASDQQGRPLWRKLTVYSSHAARHERRPLHVAIVRELRAAGAAGATSVCGLWGFHGDHAPHGDRILQLRRHVPVVTTAVDTPERAARSFELIDALTGEHGLVTSELVPALSVGPAGRAPTILPLGRHDV